MGIERIGTGVWCVRGKKSRPKFVLRPKKRVLQRAMSLRQQKMSWSDPGDIQPERWDKDDRPFPDRQIEWLVV